MLRANSKLIHSETQVSGENKMTGWIDGLRLVLILDPKDISKLVITQAIGLAKTILSITAILLGAMMAITTTYLIILKS